MKKKILLVEDEEKIVEIVAAYLVKNDYDVLVAKDGQEALQLFEEEIPDMVILDLMLPYISGEEVCKVIRQQSPIPIIMLTAKSSEDSRVDGLNLGADDYMIKPFSPRELVARVQALFRRSMKEGDLPPKIENYNKDDLIVNFGSHEVKKRGNDVNLTPNEFKILSLLTKHPNKVFTREDLIESAFGKNFDGYDRTIDSHIKNLRAKIETNTQEPRYIITVRGIGYKFGGK
ncbi:MAG: response regulator transcription factor [Anaerorhabdus sp.]